MRSIINSYYRYVGKNSTNDSNEEYLNVAPILPSDCQRDPEHEPNQAKIKSSQSQSQIQPKALGVNSCEFIVILSMS